MLFVFKQKTAYEMRISDCSSDVCSSDLSAASAPDRPAVCRLVQRPPAGPGFRWLAAGVAPDRRPAPRSCGLLARAVVQALQMNEQQRNGRWGHAGNAGCLPDCFRAVSLEFLPHFKRQATDGVVIDIRRNALLFVQIGRAHVSTPVTNAHLVCR